MSVALRGSTGLYGKTGSGSRKRSNLRRTASLEDFLDQEKNDEQIEIQEAISGKKKTKFDILEIFRLCLNKTGQKGATFLLLLIFLGENEPKCIIHCKELA